MSDQPTRLPTFEELQALYVWLAELAQKTGIDTQGAAASLRRVIATLNTSANEVPGG